MGFGLVCAGLLALLLLRIVPAEIIGFSAVAIGLRRLSRYNVYFKITFYFSILLIAFSAVDTCLWVLKFTDLQINSVLTEKVLSYTHTILLLPFQTLLLKALMTVSSDVGYDKGVRRSILASSVATVYYIAFALSCITLPISVYISFAVIILFFLNFFATFSACYTCYRAITTDEAEQKEEEKIKSFEKRFAHKKKGTPTEKKRKH